MIGASRNIWGFDPRSIPGCTIWLDGADITTFTPANPTSGTTITAWLDKASGFSFTPGAINVQSSNGTVLTPVGPTYVTGGGAFFSNATQAIGTGERALGIYQAGVTTPLFFVPNQNMTMIIASSATSNNTLRRIAQMGTYPSTANPNFLLGPQMGVSEGGSVIFDVGPAQLNYSTSTATYSTATGLRVDTMISAPAATQWWWTNGVLNTFTNSNIYTSTFSNYPVNFFFLGAYTNTVDGNRCYLGNIYEVLFYSNALTTSQRQTVEGYLANKWGFKASLPTTNPFRAYPPLVRSFSPTDIPGCSLWLDAADNSSMNSTTTVTSWSDKSGLGNTMTGTATWSGSNMTFNGSTQAFSNTSYVFPISAYSMFAVYSNTTAPASTAYMNAVYGNGGYPMLGVYDVNKSVSARSVVANTGALGATAVGWAARIAGTTTSQDFGRGIATDSSGNVFVTGYYDNALTIYNQGPSGTAGTTLPFTGGYDCFVAKYSSAGVVVWAARIAGTSTSFDFGYGIATDSSGNVFVTGSYDNALTLYNQGPSGTAGTTLPFTGGYDCFVAKYSSAGAVVWAARIAGTTTSYDYGYGIATDSSGNVLVTGQYGAAVTFYNQGPSGTAGTTLPYTGGVDCFVAKYSSAGAVVWAAQIAGTTTSSDIGYGIATDSSGNVFVTGSYSAALTLYNTGGTAGTTLPFTGAQDCFVAKYSSAGAVVWAARIAGTTTSIDVGYGIATDSSGNVLVTGYYSAALTLYNQGPSGTAGNTLPFTGGNDVFVAKYSSAGAVVWAAQIASTGAVNDFGYGIATDSSGNVFVTGYYSAALTLYNQGPSGTAGTTLPFTGGFDCFIAKYNPDGYITAPVPASSNVLVDATYTPSTMSPFVNGTTATTLAGTTLAATGIYVGGPSNYFNGSISELLIYSANLSVAQRRQVEGYLTNKWGLNSQIVAGHPYKLIPPTTPQPAQYNEVTQGNWTRDWQPYLQSLAAANATGVTVTTTNITGGAIYTANGWHGAVLGPDGNMYCAPYAAPNILKLNVSTGVTTNITGGATYGNLYSGGALGPDGSIYFGPFGPNILKLNVATGVTTTITGGATYPTNPWFGGVLGPDGNIYFTPYSATNILKLNVSTGVTTNVTGGATFTTNAWWAGVLGPDGCIYLAPQASPNILKFDVVRGVATTITGGATYTTNGWQGGVLGPDGCIYFAPNQATNVLKLNVATGVTTNITGGATYTSGGWYGGALGPDGNIYFAPASATNILKLTVATGVTTNITGGASITSFGHYGALLAPDGNIYFSPYGATNIIKLTFTGLSQLPSLAYCTSAYANRF